MRARVSLASSLLCCPARRPRGRTHVLGVFVGGGRHGVPRLGPQEAVIAPAHRHKHRQARTHARRHTAHTSGTNASGDERTRNERCRNKKQGGNVNAKRTQSLEQRGQPKGMDTEKDGRNRTGKAVKRTGHRRGR